MLVFVAGSMITLGLGLTVSQIVEPFKNIKMVLLALVSNFVIVPLFAFSSDFDEHALPFLLMIL